MEEEEVTEVAGEEVEIEEEIMADRGLLTDTERIGTEEDLQGVEMIEMIIEDLLLIDAEDITMMMVGEAMNIVVAEVEDEAEDVEATGEVTMMTTTAATTITMVTMLEERIRRIDFQTISSTFNQKMIP